jgi:tetratricopeptide (TPR) repeat protein
MSQALSVEYEETSITQSEIKYRFHRVYKTLKIYSDSIKRAIAPISSIVISSTFSRISNYPLPELFFGGFDLTPKAQVFLAILACVSLSSCGQAMHIDAAQRLEGSGDINAAIAEYRLAIQDDPNNANLHTLLGKILAKKGNSSESIKEFQEAVRCDVQSPATHLQLGQAYLNNGSLFEAQREFDIITVYDPQSATPIYCSGLVLEKKGDFKGAISKYREAIKKDPNFSAAHTSLGMLIGRTGGDPAEARHELDEGLRLSGNLAQK